MASPGLEVLFASVKSQINHAQDCIICVCHWQIVSAGFKCIGKGEKATREDDEDGTEMLPDGWSSSADCYILRYRQTSSHRVYILKTVVVDGMLLVHFWKDGTDKVATMDIAVDDYTTGDLTSCKKSLKNVNDLCKRFKGDILTGLGTSSPKAGSSKKGNSSREPDEDHDPLRVPDRRSQRPRPEWQEPDDPFSIGRGDLDPFGGMGGGMLFDPMRGGRGPRFGMDPSAGLPNRLPPGAVPPGARFDPFGPPGTHPGQRPGPDPDHMKPPDYDDMFM